MWFRRDLRTRDNPALLEACADGEVLPFFVLDPALWVWPDDGDEEWPLCWVCLALTC